jgi:hypothetical protein
MNISLVIEGGMTAFKKALLLYDVSTVRTKTKKAKIRALYVCVSLDVTKGLVHARQVLYDLFTPPALNTNLELSQALLSMTIWFYNSHFNLTLPNCVI